MKMSPIARSKHPTSGAIDQMNVEEIEGLFKSSSETMEVRTLIDCVRRLLEMAFFERSLTDEQADYATAFAKKIIEDVEKAIGDDQQTLEGFRKAYQHQIQGGRLMGRGSLAWEIDDLPPDEIVAHVIKPSSGSRLPDLIAVQERAGTWPQVKPATLYYLILDRRRNFETDATLTLGRLVASADPVAWNVLYPAERDLFLLVDRKYFDARMVLEKNGILPPLPKRATKYKKPKAKDLLPILLKCVSLEDSPGAWEVNEDLKSRMNILDEHQTTGLDLMLTAFRIKSSIDILASLFGERYAEKMEKNLLTDVFQKTKAEHGDYLDWAIKTVRAAEKHIRLNKPEQSLDFTSFVMFSDHYFPEDTDAKEDVSPVAEAVTEILGSERTFFSQKFRFMLAYHFRKVPPQDLPQDPSDSNSYAWEYCLQESSS